MVNHESEQRPRLLFVEGGGDKNPTLATECRRAFSELFSKAGIRNKPRVVACGGRHLAFKQFRQAHSEAPARAWILVDAETLPAAAPGESPWVHVKARQGDAWDRPPGAEDHQLHLMTVVMETWLLADQAALQKVFGPRLDASRLPSEGPSLEGLDKAAVDRALQSATRQTSSRRYDKGDHSFRALAQVDPEKLSKLPWAKRFLDELRKD